jgi:cytochrome c-type biogenesis protein CcmH
MISRRAWLRGAAMGAAASIVSRPGVAQQSGAIVDTSNLFEMDQTAAKTVRLPPKPGAMPSMTPEARDDLEHRIRCQCGCTLDVFTCRTTDFSCQVSPAMHRDIMALVAGGYTADEILDAHVDVYGERALMAPKREGFNILGYVVPSIAIGVVAIALVFMLRRWKRASTAPATPAASGPAIVPPGATADELRRLDAAIRDDS